MMNPILTVLCLTTAGMAQDYSTCTSWDQMVSQARLKYASVKRISDPGTQAQPAYSGFWFYDEQQFDVSGRYALAMKVYFQERRVTPSDRGDIGYIDLQNGNAWTKIGETSAWNWQQGCRLQWRPHSDEILWDDRDDDGRRFVCRAYNFKRGTTRTLPRPVYDVSNDGAMALTHDFARMLHAGTAYVGIPDRYAKERTPSESGVERMDMETGEVEFLVGIERIAQLAFPNGYAARTNLYFFREGWNPSGTRFIAFLRNLDSPRHVSGWSISADGRDVRYFFDNPSHHVWLDDRRLFEGRYFSLIKDDGSGHIQAPLAKVDANIDPTFLPVPYDDWILGDTYVLDGVQHLFLFHQPTKLFVPLAKLKATGAKRGIFRVDLHARCNRNGRMVAIDATHENLGRQLYIVDIGYILDSPPETGSKQSHPADVTSNSS